ncbi:NTPase [Pyrobaculum aerophilum]|uniref:Nucleoside-triphosphatase CGL51_00430 n=1 Tax=Pyrobaculum aerophilum TaxID=13773 RepID=A0A371R421_9CREN|nr:NTPase [Pyrobaculum aerophilum]RFA98533.1 nucleoside triphosphatase [Pyrobaculum aerophilum]RFA99236.1 nucleoside triphosphatase [Pyrobaculum aerophilum]
MTWRERAELRIGISGMPGVGKTTLVLKIAELARSRVKVCGFVTVEVREGGTRIGFDVVDLANGRHMALARVGRGEPSVGKYVVNLEACNVISEALRRECDLKIIDEIGAMEFKCKNFGEDLQTALHMSPRVIATVHRNYIDIAKKLGLEIIWLTRENWGLVFRQLLIQLGLTQ